jgi:hypothetical protein
MEAMRCFARLTDRQREWYLLVRSVGRRDAPAMAAHSRTILTRGYATRSVEDARYAVMAGLLGHVTKGTPGQGFMLWLQMGQQAMPIEAVDARLLLGLVAMGKRPAAQVVGRAPPETAAH